MEKLIRPALEGVENVLAAVDRVGGVKRVVITSSISAVVGDHYERGRYHLYNEDDWDLSATDTFLPYHRCAHPTRPGRRRGRSRGRKVVVEDK